MVVLGSLERVPEISPTASALPYGYLLAGVVRLVDVDQSPRPDTVQLQDRFALGFRVVMHPRRDQPERASRQRIHLRLVDLLAHADHQRAADDGYVLRGRVEVR